MDGGRDQVTSTYQLGNASQIRNIGAYAVLSDYSVAACSRAHVPVEALPINVLLKCD